jgi:hypothetical protein
MLVTFFYFTNFYKCKIDFLRLLFMMKAGLKHKTYSQQKERSQKMETRNKVFIGKGRLK